MQPEDMNAVCVAIHDHALYDSSSPEKMADYLSTLSAINKSHAGIVSFRWPTVPFPLYFRCGSSDLSNFIQIFVHQEYGFEVPYKPRRIVDLGAYVGYASAYLATRFPDAHIIAVEPDLENFRMLGLNASAYGNLKIVNAAVWGASTNVQIERSTAGDWGTRFSEGSDTGHDVKALTMRDILNVAGWRDADFIKCDIEGAELMVFSESKELISSMAMCCAIETHEIIAPGCVATVERCFDEDLFTHSRSGEFDVFIRRNVDSMAGIAPKVVLLRPSHGLRVIALRSVPAEPWGYYLFGDASCQLHPSCGDQPLPEVSTVVTMAGQATFESGLDLQNPFGYGVWFIVEIRHPNDNSLVFQARRCIMPGERCHWVIEIPKLHGLFRVGLQTTMVDSAQTNHQAIANWLTPLFQ